VGSKLPTFFGAIERLGTLHETMIVIEMLFVHFPEKTKWFGTTSFAESSCNFNTANGELTSYF
jgi:hypothetical protein